jgi:hypothetical protein
VGGKGASSIPRCVELSGITSSRKAMTYPRQQVRQYTLQQPVQLEIEAVA